MSAPGSPDYSAPSPSPFKQEPVEPVDIDLDVDQVQDKHGSKDVEMSSAVPDAVKPKEGIDDMNGKMEVDTDTEMDMDTNMDTSKTNGNGHVNHKPNTSGHPIPTPLNFHLIRQEHDHLTLPHDLDLSIPLITSTLPSTLPKVLPSFAPTADGMGPIDLEEEIKQMYEDRGMEYGMRVEGLTQEQIGQGVVRGLNGDLGFRRTGEVLVDLFMALKEGGDMNKIPGLLELAWKANPLDTLKITFYTLDVRDGKSNNEAFHVCAGWLMDQHPETLCVNLKQVGLFGCWKDLSEILMHIAVHEDDKAVKQVIDSENKRIFGLQRSKGQTRKVKTVKRQEKLDMIDEQAKFQKEVRRKIQHRRKMDPAYEKLYQATIQTFATQLREDLSTTPTSVKSISLAAKWFPAEGKSYDKYLNMYEEIACAMSGVEKKDCTAGQLEGLKANLRKDVLRPLKERLRLVESKMSQGKWDKIEYSKVPAICMKINSAVFHHHDQERYTAFLEDAKKGKAKVKAATLKPHQIAGKFITALGTDMKPAEGYEKDLLEAQWINYVEKLKESGTLSSTIAIIDTSGSMYGLPITVAVSLGLLTAEVAAEPWTGSMITFSSEPTFIQVDVKDSLENKVRAIERAKWMMTTDYEKVFQLILNKAIQAGVPRENMVKRIITLSDMQFNQSLTGGDTSAWMSSFERIKALYEEAGYEMPEMVFWTINKQELAHPVTAFESNTCLISGFSGNLLKLFLEEGKLAVPEPAEGEEKKEINSEVLMRRAIGKEVYEVLRVVD